MGNQGVRGLVAFAVALSISWSRLANGAELVEFKLDDFGWQFETSSDRCVAMGEFNFGNRAAHLELRKFTPSDVFQAIIIANGLHAGAGPGQVRLFPADDPSDISTMVRIAVNGNKGGAIFRLSLTPTKILTTKQVKELKKAPPKSKAELDQARTARLAAIDGIHIDSLFSEPVVMRTGDWTAMMRTLDACTDKLLTGWGLEPTIQQNLSRPVEITNAVEVAEALGSIYPIDARNPRTSAIIGYRLLIDEKGKVGDCLVFSPSIPAYAKASCTALKQSAHFHPALDAEGKPVPSYYMSTIVYLSPL